MVPVQALSQVQAPQTLRETAQQVVLTNPEVLARWHVLQAASDERDAAVGGFFPRVDVAAGAGRDRFNEPTLRSDLNRSSAAISLTQLLYDGFFTSNEVKRLDYARRVRLFELYDVTESAALEAARAYLDVLRFRALLVLAEENYVRHKSVFDQIQRKAAAGVARRVDLEQAAGRLALAESNLLTETANLHDVSARFQRLVGAPPRKNMEMPALLNKGIPADVRTAVQVATEMHPALQAAIENVRSADRSAKARYGAYQPRVDFRIRSEAGRNLSGLAGDTHNNTAEVVLNWNLFNGGSDVARARQYAELLNSTRDQRDRTCRDLRQTLVIAYNDIRKLSEQMTYLDQHQLSIEKARDAYRRQFDIGQRTLLDVLDTENELFQAKRAYVNAEYDLQTAYARTHAGIGTLYSALGLTRLQAGQLPPATRDEAAGIEGCAAEGPDLYVADKAQLNARAQELIRESIPSATEPGQNGPNGAAPALPATRSVPTPPAPLPDAAPGAAPGAEARPSGKRALVDALNAWSAAWSARNVQAYLDTYAPGFRPADGSSRETWAARRRRALEKTPRIELGIARIQIEMKGPQTAITTFTQSYQSPSYQDVTEKTLEWENIGGRWLIVRETAAAVR